MDIGSIFLLLGLLLLVGLFVARPLLEQRSVSVTQADTKYSALLAERERILTALQELDFDYALGKVPEEDYPEQRDLLLQRGAEVLQQLDELNAAGRSESLEDRLEAAIATRKADRQRPTAKEGEDLMAEPLLAAAAAGGARNSVARRLANGGDDELETLIANRRRERSEKAAGFCPQCGGAVQKSDRFCPKCGTSLG